MIQHSNSDILTQIILLRKRLGPPSHEPRRRRHTGLEIILHGPKRQIAANIGARACEHGCPLSSGVPKVSLPTSSPRLPKRPTPKEKDVRISINSPLPARSLERRHPLLRQRLISRRTELPRVARVASGGAGGFDIEPEVVHDDVVGVDGVEEFVELGLDRLAGDAVGSAGACVDRGVELEGKEQGKEGGGITGVHVGVEAGDAGGFGGTVDGNHVAVYSASLE